MTGNHWLTSLLGLKSSQPGMSEPAESSFTGSGPDFFQILLQQLGSETNMSFSQQMPALHADVAIPPVMHYFDQKFTSGIVPKNLSGVLGLTRPTVQVVTSASYPSDHQQAYYPGSISSIIQQIDYLGRTQELRIDKLSFVWQASNIFPETMEPAQDDFSVAFNSDTNGFSLKIPQRSNWTLEKVQHMIDMVAQIVMINAGKPVVEIKPDFRQFHDNGRLNPEPAGNTPISPVDADAELTADLPARSVAQLQRQLPEQDRVLLMQWMHDGQIKIPVTIDMATDQTAEYIRQLATIIAGQTSPHELATLVRQMRSVIDKLPAADKHVLTRVFRTVLRHVDGNTQTADVQLKKNVALITNQSEHGRPDETTALHVIDQLREPSDGDDRSRPEHVLSRRIGAQLSAREMVNQREYVDEVGKHRQTILTAGSTGAIVSTETGTDLSETIRQSELTRVMEPVLMQVFELSSTGNAATSQMAERVNVNEENPDPITGHSAVQYSADESMPDYQHIQNDIQKIEFMDFQAFVRQLMSHLSAEGKQEVEQAWQLLLTEVSDSFGQEQPLETAIPVSTAGTWLKTLSEKLSTDESLAMLKLLLQFNKDSQKPVKPDSAPMPPFVEETLAEQLAELSDTTLEQLVQAVDGQMRREQPVENSMKETLPTSGVQPQSLDALAAHFSESGQSIYQQWRDRIGDQAGLVNKVEHPVELMDKSSQSVQGAVETPPIQQTSRTDPAVHQTIGKSETMSIEAENRPVAASDTSNIKPHFKPKKQQVSESQSAPSGGQLIAIRKQLHNQLSNFLDQALPQLSPEGAEQLLAVLHTLVEVPQEVTDPTAVSHGIPSSLSSVEPVQLKDSSNDPYIVVSENNKAVPLTNKQALVERLVMSDEFNNSRDHEGDVKFALRKTDVEPLNRTEPNHWNSEITWLDVSEKETDFFQQAGQAQRSTSEIQLNEKSHELIKLVQRLTTLFHSLKAVLIADDRSVIEKAWQDLQLPVMPRIPIAKAVNDEISYNLPNTAISSEDAAANQRKIALSEGMAQEPKRMDATPAYSPPRSLQFITRTIQQVEQAVAKLARTDEQAFFRVAARLSDTAALTETVITVDDTGNSNSLANDSGQSYRQSKEVARSMMPDNPGSSDVFRTDSYIRTISMVRSEQSQIPNQAERLNNIIIDRLKPVHTGQTPEKSGVIEVSFALKTDSDAQRRRPEVTVPIKVESDNKSLTVHFPQTKEAPFKPAALFHMVEQVTANTDSPKLEQVVIELNQPVENSAQKTPGTIQVHQEELIIRNEHAEKPELIVRGEPELLKQVEGKLDTLREFRIDNHLQFTNKAVALVNRNGNKKTEPAPASQWRSSRPVQLNSNAEMKETKARLVVAPSVDGQQTDSDDFRMMDDRKTAMPEMKINQTGGSRPEILSAKSEIPVRQADAIDQQIQWPEKGNTSLFFENAGERMDRRHETHKQKTAQPADDIAGRKHRHIHHRVSSRFEQHLWQPAGKQRVAPEPQSLGTNIVSDQKQNTPHVVGDAIQMSAGQVRNQPADTAPHSQYSAEHVESSIPAAAGQDTADGHTAAHEENSQSYQQPRSQAGIFSPGHFNDIMQREQVANLKTHQPHQGLQQNNGTLETFVKAEQLVEQLSQQLRVQWEQGRHELAVKLYPERLGEVHVKMAVEKDVMTLRIVVDNMDAKHLMEQNLSQLQKGLQEQHVRVDRFEVMVKHDTQQFQQQHQANDNYQQQFAHQRQSRQAPQFEVYPDHDEKVVDIDEPRPHKRMRRPNSILEVMA